MPASSEDYPLFAEFNGAMCDAVRLYTVKLRESDPLATVTLDYICESNDALDKFVYTLTARSGGRVIERKELTFVWESDAIIKHKSDDFRHS